MSEPEPSLGRRLRLLGLLGVLGPPVYVGAVILGGFLWPGYSQYAETVSTLLSSGAPNQAVLVPLFAFYNLCVLALALGLNGGILPSRWGVLGPAFMGAAAVDGLVLFAFPQGPWEAPLSGTGVQHTVIAAFGALFSLLALGFLWRRMRQDVRWRGPAGLTLGFLVAAVLAGAFGAASITAPYAGLAERLSIGTFLLWTELTAVLLIRRSSSGTVVSARRVRRPSPVVAEP